MRPIDADAMLKELKPIDYEMEHSGVLISDVSNIMRNWVNRQPTLTLKCPLCYSDKQRHNTPPNEPLTQAELDSMDYDKVWIDYEDGTGEWALVCNGYIYSIDTLEGAGFDFVNYMRGERLEPHGYKVYRRPAGGRNMKRYSESLEQWEQEAYLDGYGADWLADIGEGVKYYAMECEAKGRRPTFAGLIRYIDRKRCRQPAEEDT